MDLVEGSKQRPADECAGLDVPEAWLAWPITAGGLGLAQPTILAQPYAAGLARRKRPAAPEGRPPDWQHRAKGWATLPARRALLAAGYTSLNQLAQASEAELLRLHGMGPKAIAQLRQALAAQGLSFAEPTNI